jgi:hypothetical protein
MAQGRTRYTGSRSTYATATLTNATALTQIEFQIIKQHLHRVLFFYYHVILHRGIVPKIVLWNLICRVQYSSTTTVCA